MVDNANEPGEGHRFGEGTWRWALLSRMLAIVLGYPLFSNIGQIASTTDISTLSEYSVSIKNVGINRAKLFKISDKFFGG